MFQSLPSANSVGRPGRNEDHINYIDYIGIYVYSIHTHILIYIYTVYTHGMNKYMEREPGMYVYIYIYLVLWLASILGYFSFVMQTLKEQFPRVKMVLKSNLCNTRKSLVCPPVHIYIYMAFGSDFSERGTLQRKSFFSSHSLQGNVSMNPVDLIFTMAQD